MTPKQYSLDIEVDEVNMHYHDQTEAGTKVGAAQIFWARLPENMKDEWRPEILENYISVSLVVSN